MAVTLYPGGDQPVTQNLGLALWDMSLTMAENFELLDSAVAAGSVKTNGASVPAPNFVDNASVTFSVTGSNISANAANQLASAILGTAGYLPNPKFVSIYTAFVNPGASSNNDVYTVPAGRRALIFAYQISNANGGSTSTFTGLIKISGTYYRLMTQGASTAAATGFGFSLNAPYIAEAGETFAIAQTTNTSWFVTGMVIEFDNTSNMKSVKVLGPGSGDNTLYTAPVGKNAILIGSISGMQPLTAPQVLLTNSTAATTIGAIINYVRFGGVANASNRLSVSGGASVSAQTTAAIQSGVAGMVIAAGDALSVNLSAATPTGFLWCSVMELAA